MRAYPARHGFTLIELLAVILIIAVLFAILVAGTRSVLRMAGTAKCTSNLRSIGAATHLYFQDKGTIAQIHQGLDENGERLASNEASFYARLVLGGYIEDAPDAFSCPNNSYTDEQGWQNPSNISLRGITYGWNNLIHDGHNPSKMLYSVTSELVQGYPMVVCMDTSPEANNKGANVNYTLSSRIGYHHDSHCNVLFPDVHVEKLLPEDLDEESEWKPPGNGNWFK